MLSIRFAQRRAERTCETQAVLSKTGWRRKTVEEWKADLSELEDLKSDEGRKRVQLRHVARRWQETLDRIQKVMRLVKQLGKLHFDRDPARKHLVSRLRTDGRSRTAIYDQGLAAHDAWKEADEAWEIFEDTTLETFAALLKQAETWKCKHSRKSVAWRRAVATLMAKARAIDAENMAWHKVALVRFPAGTVDGDLIRSRVPTTTRPRKSRAKRRVVPGPQAKDAASEGVSTAAALPSAA